MQIDYRAYPVLYVDDEEPNLLAFEYTFGDTFQVEIVSSPERALQRLHSRRYGVLLCDQRMPGMSGVELCVRARHLVPDTVRMIVTAYADLHAASDAVNDGRVMRYITKPYNNDEMEDILKAAIESYHAAMVLHELRSRIVHSGSKAAIRATEHRIGHEMNNMLQSITMNLDLMRDYLGLSIATTPNPPPDQLEQLMEELRACTEDIRFASDKLSQFAQRLLGRQPPTRGRYQSDLTRLVEGSVRLARSHEGVRAPIYMVVEASPVVDMEPVALGQVVLNLLVNAGQSLADRSGGEVKVRVDVSKDRAHVVVSDNGPGVPRENLERIFDPFFTTKATGSGHGLALAKLHVEQAGGTLSVDSTPNVKTTFTLDLPISH